MPVQTITQNVNIGPAEKLAKYRGFFPWFSPCK